MLEKSNLLGCGHSLPYDITNTLLDYYYLKINTKQKSDEFIDDEDEYFTIHYKYSKEDDYENDEYYKEFTDDDYEEFTDDDNIEDNLIHIIPKEEQAKTDDSSMDNKDEIDEKIDFEETEENYDDEIDFNKEEEEIFDEVKENVTLSINYRCIKQRLLDNPNILELEALFGNNMDKYQDYVTKENLVEISNLLEATLKNDNDANIKEQMSDLIEALKDLATDERIPSNEESEFEVKVKYKGLPIINDEAALKAGIYLAGGALGFAVSQTPGGKIVKGAKLVISAGTVITAVNQIATKKLGKESKIVKVINKPKPFCDKVKNKIKKLPLMKKVSNRKKEFVENHQVATIRIKWFVNGFFIGFTVGNISNLLDFKSNVDAITGGSFDVSKTIEESGILEEVDAANSNVTCIVEDTLDNIKDNSIPAYEKGNEYVNSIINQTTEKAGEIKENVSGNEYFQKGKNFISEAINGSKEKSLEIKEDIKNWIAAKGNSTPITFGGDDIALEGTTSNITTTVENDASITGIENISNSEYIDTIKSEGLFDNISTNKAMDFSCITDGYSNVYDLEQGNSVSLASNYFKDVHIKCFELNGNYYTGNLQNLIDNGTINASNMDKVSIYLENEDGVPMARTTIKDVAQNVDKIIGKGKTL